MTVNLHLCTDKLMAIKLLNGKPLYRDMAREKEKSSDREREGGEVESEKL